MDLAAVERCEKSLEARAIALDASAAFERRSPVGHRTTVVEVTQVLAASFLDAGAWHVATVDESAEAEIGSAGMEEGENR